MRPLVERGHPEISVRRQCELLGVNRSGLYYEPVGESGENLMLMRLLDEQYTRTPFYGSRKMTEWLATEGHAVNRKRVSRLMELLGLEAVYPKPKLSQPGENHRIYPYLLRGTTVERVNQVWSTDITYIRMAHGFLYLVAVMDWFSRFVLSWSLSLTMEVEFCVEALKRALRRGRPDIFNSDRGAQFTSEKFTGELAGRQIAISMDGRGRCMDNIFVARLWRSLKCEFPDTGVGLGKDGREAGQSWCARGDSHLQQRLDRLSYPTPMMVRGKRPPGSNSQPSPDGSTARVLGLNGKR
jgi:putative transposase